MTTTEMLSPHTSIRAPDFGHSKYSQHEYFGFPITIRNEDGYVNATTLCREIAARTGRVKKLRNFMSSEKWRGITDAMQKRYGVQMVFEVNNVGNGLRGHYIHPKLVHHITDWASIEYSIIVGDVMDKIHERNILSGRDTTNEVITKLREENEEIKQKLIDSGVQIADLNMRAVPEEHKESYMILINETDVKGKYRVTKRVMRSLNAKHVRELEETAIIKRFYLPIALSFAKDMAKELGLTFKQHHYIGVTDENLEQIRQYLANIPSNQ